LDENDETLCNSPNLSPHTVSSSLEKRDEGERERELRKWREMKMEMRRKREND